MSAQEYARYPESIRLRETEINGRILVSTMLDPAHTSAAELARLYKMRWNIEIDFRTIKATLEMDVLRCKSPERIAKEVSVYFLAYNLVRWAMAKAAYLTETLPRVLSFSGARRLINTFADEQRRHAARKVNKLMGIVLNVMGSQRLPYRPDRVEPRAKKRKPKNLPLLTVPRNIARAQYCSFK